MARIKILNLPEDRKISRGELNRIFGGFNYYGPWDYPGGESTYEDSSGSGSTSGSSSSIPSYAAWISKLYKWYLN